MKTKTLIGKEAAMKTAMNFVEYVWSFYGPHKIHGDFFKNNLKPAECFNACAERMSTHQFEGDSFDREAVRDIMLSNRKVA